MASLEAGLVAKEQNKFVLTTNGKTAIIVANDDGTNVFGGTPIGISSLPSINGTIALTGLVSLASGTNILVNNLVSVASVNGIFTVAGGSLASINGDVSVKNLVSIASITGNVAITGLVSLPSGTQILVNNLVSIASINGKVDVNTITNLASLASLYGLVQVNNVASIASLYGQVQVVGGLLSLASGTHILVDNTASLASIYGLVQVNNVASLASLYGQVQLVNGLISLASGTTVLTKEQNLISLASGQYIAIAANSSLPALPTGSNFIGLATIVPGYQSVTANYTSFSTLISASGAASLFAPPNNQRWVVKDLIIGSSGFNEVNIQSGGSIVLIPYIGLATQGGYVSNFGESGMRGVALNDAFIVNKKSTATISIYVNVRFDPT